MHVYTVEYGNVDNELEVLCSIWATESRAIESAVAAIVQVFEDAELEDDHDWSFHRREHDVLVEIHRKHDSYHPTEWWRIKKQEVQE